MKINQQPKCSIELLFPCGTCSPQQYQKLQAIKTSLNSPFIQYTVFSPNIINFSWIVKKQSDTKNQPIYHLYCQTLRKRFLSAQKQPNNIGCNYLISKNQKPNKNEQFVGKLRGNFRNNEFIIYDNGQNPKKKTGRKRKQFGSIKFNEESIFSKQNEEKIQIIVPQVRQVNQQFDPCPRYLPKQFIPNEQKQNLLYELGQKHSPDVIQLIQAKNIKSKRDQQIVNEIQSLLQKQLNIKLKMQYPLLDQDVFKFQTRSKTTYRLKFSYPLNIIQGFGIALAFIQRNSQ